MQILRIYCLQLIGISKIQLFQKGFLHVKYIIEIMTNSIVSTLKLGLI